MFLRRRHYKNNRLKNVFLIFSISNFFILSNANAQTQPTLSFHKNASQFCFSKLSAAEQNKYYDRILNLGASFTHGCTACDSSPVMRAFNAMSDDSHVIRRHYFSQFHANAPWKDLQSHAFERIIVLENDANTRFSMIPDWQVARDGYKGLWTYDVESDRVLLMDDASFSNIKNSQPQFEKEAKLVGGITTQYNLRGKGEAINGVLYQTFPGHYAASGAVPYTVFDLSSDGARMGDVFRLHGDPVAYGALMASRWTDETLREHVVQSTINRLRSLNSHIIFSIDMLFWDSIAHTYSLLRDSHPKSFVVKFALALATRSPGADGIFNEVQRHNITVDFERMLKGLSTGDFAHAPVPILLGRLLDDPAKVFNQLNYQPIIGALLGQFMSAVTGRDFTTEFTEWLRKISYVKGENAKITPLESSWYNRIKNGWSNSPAKRQPRLEGFTDSDSGVSFSADEVTLARKSYEKYEILLEEELEKRGLTAKILVQKWQDAETFQSNKSPYRADPAGGGQPGTLLPASITGIANALILSALGDLPLFIQSLSSAMNLSNERSRVFTERTDNNVHLLNVDAFYKNFATFLKPETMHPTVYGAKLMAELVDKSVCESEGPQ